MFYNPSPDYPILNFNIFLFKQIINFSRYQNCQIYEQVDLKKKVQFFKTTIKQINVMFSVFYNY
jgi:hypothetical protein